MRRPPAIEALASLRACGARTWVQALLMWSLSGPCCHVAVPANWRPGRMTENVVAGAPQWFGPDECAYVARLAADG